MRKMVVCAKCRKVFAPVFDEQKCPDCVDCRLELHLALGQLAKALSARIGDKPCRPTGGRTPHNIVAEVKKKQERTSADSFRPRQTKVK